jgi:hypothetical protein
MPVASVSVQPAFRLGWGLVCTLALGFSGGVPGLALAAAPPGLGAGGAGGGSSTSVTPSKTSLAFLVPALMLLRMPRSLLASLPATPP